MSQTLKSEKIDTEIDFLYNACAGNYIHLRKPIESLELLIFEELMSAYCSPIYSRNGLIVGILGGHYYFKTQ
jgi:hypothetical protein